MCDDLGADRCALWNKNDRPGFPGTGRRPTRSCVNAFGNYDITFNAVKTGVDALAAVQNGAASAGASEPATKGDDEDPKAKGAPPLADTERCRALADKLCADLGNEVCEAWKKGGMAGLEANDVQCKMAMDKALFYDKHLKRVRAAL
ncbi:MAG: hypothetical protein AAGN82_08015 [Myxococcota bacterium]